MSSELHRVGPSRPTILPSDLTEEQTALLLEIAQPYAAAGQWPIWDYVVRRMRRRHLDARKVLDSLPRVGVRDAVGTSYGFTQGGVWRMYGEGEKVQLTVAAALAVQELRPILSDPFLRVLHHMIALQRSVDPSPAEITQVTLDSEELAKAIPGLKPEFIAALPEILTGEPSTWGGGQSGPNLPHDPSWRRGIREDIEDYADATDLESYVDKVCEIIQARAWENNYQQFQAMQYQAIPAPRPELNGILPPAVEQIGSTPAPAVEVDAATGEPYLDLQLLGDLEDAGSKAGWALDKLLDLCRELNSNVADRHKYASAALVRMIMDHVPTIFSVRGYEAITNLPKGQITETDRAHLKKLAEYRTPADDVIHRQARKTASRIGMGDLAPRTFVNALLQCVLEELLRQAAAAQP